MSTISPYTGDGSTTQFDITFSYRDASTVKASVDGVETDDFTFVNPSRIQFGTAPAAEAEIRIFRETPVSSPEVAFEDGAIIRGSDLNDAVAQPRERVEEVSSEVNAISVSALRAPVGEALPSLPIAASRSEKYLAFDASGKPVAVAAVGPDEPLRPALASSDEGKGGALVKLPTGRTVTDKLAEVVSSEDRPFTPAPLAEEPSEFATRGNWGLGTNVLPANVGGFNNLAFGDNVLVLSQYGRNNIGIGNDVLTKVVGDETGARGEEAPGTPGTYFAAGDNNIGIGGFALRDLETGFENLAIGSYSLRGQKTGKWNTAVGTMSQVLAVDTTGCVSIGNYNLVINTGNFNFAGGHAALEGNQTGTGNVAIGHIAMNANTTGSFNTATGAFAARRQTSATFTVAFGYEALQNLLTGTNNSAFGANALNAFTSGNNNLAIGTNALLILATGDGNVAIGSGAGNTTPSGTNNSISIGTGCSADKSNQAVIGGPGITETIIRGVTRHTVFTAATLPSAATVGAGARAFVSDASISDWSTAFGSVVIGGSSNVVPVYSTGSDWRIG